MNIEFDELFILLIRIKKYGVLFLLIE